MIGVAQRYTQHRWVNAREPALSARHIPSAEVIEAGFSISFFGGEKALLPLIFLVRLNIRLDPKLVNRHKI